MFDALFTFTHLITYFISFFEMCEFDDTVKNMNESEILLTSAYKNEEKNFSCSILIFFSNVVIMWSVSSYFNDKNWESFLNNWLSILIYFAKHHIDFNVLLNSCICDLKCIHFICLMILFLWSLYFKYSFHAFNVFYVFSIENMLHTLHATYIKHDLYADFLLKFKRSFKEFFLQLDWSR